MAVNALQENGSGRPNWVEIDETAIAHNLGVIRRLTSADTRIFVALKGNACGCGFVSMARLVTEAGAYGIATVDLGEAIEIRRAGIKAPLLLYGGNLIDAETVALIAHYNLIPTVHDRTSREALCRFAPRRLNVFVEINVGGERMGFTVNEVPEAVAALQKSPELSIGGVYAHMHVPSDEVALSTAQWQYQRFQQSLHEFDKRGVGVPISMIASSKVLMLTNSMSLGAVDPGHLIFGFDPGGSRLIELPIKPVFLGLKSRLVHISVLDRSELLEQVPFPSRKQVRYGIIPMGHADQLDLIHADCVLVRGRRAPLLGKPMAEHTRIDLTDCTDAQVGDEVAIIGDQCGAKITLDDVAKRRNGVRVTDVTRAIPRAIPRRPSKSLHG